MIFMEGGEGAFIGHYDWIFALERRTLEYFSTAPVVDNSISRKNYAVVIIGKIGRSKYSNRKIMFCERDRFINIFLNAWSLATIDIRIVSRIIVERLGYIKKKRVKRKKSSLIVAALFLAPFFMFNCACV